ncbi:MAG: DUF2141 domain-containing protein [Paracoccaceae bacterium]|nr:DUF2141 domain-containing protein [Paracoccaceae bacterium]
MWLTRTLCLIAVALSAMAAPAQAQALALDIRPHEAAATCGARAPQIAVSVSGVTPKGILTVELYRPSARDFLRKASRIHRIRVPAEQGVQTVCFDIEKPGTYAVAAYHDLNADRSLDRKWNQMPAEPFALSNNRPLRLAMPNFDEAAFQVGYNGVSIRIELQK